MDVEPVDTIHTFQFFETIEGYFAGAGDELEQLGSFFLVEGPDSTPEPLDLLRRRIVVLVLRVALPVIYVNVGETRDEQLQLLFVEDGDELRRNNLMET